VFYSVKKAVRGVFMKWLVLTLATVATLGWVSPVRADPIDVSYAVTGSTGDWTLDFSVTNNLSGAPNEDLYFFGVDLSSTNITGYPTNFIQQGLTWNNSFDGGSNVNYNNLWIDQVPSDNSYLPGTTISGFDVTISDALAPTSVNWFAYTADTGGVGYFGGGNFNASITNSQFNPGFEGVSGSPSTDPAPVPEPGSVFLLGSGLAFVAKRVRHGTWGRLCRVLA
jgi:hypothetical protein